MPDRTDDLREALYFALSSDYEIESADYRRAAGLLVHLGWVPLADVLDALEEEGRLAAWRLTPDAADVYFRAMTMLAARFATTAPEGEPTMPAALAAGHPLDDVDGTFGYIDDLLRRRTTAPEGADERSGHG